MKKKISLIFGILLTGILVNTSHSSPYWAKVYWGTSEYWGSHDEGIEQVRQTTDFGYILAGYSRSFTATGEAGWLFKLNQKGDVVWGKTYTGSYTDKFKDVQQTLDGGYIVAGFTHIPGAGRSDAWILKLNSSGEIIWQKTYGEDEYNYAYSIQQTSDGGYIVAGTMDVDPNNNGNYDSWILKLDPNGDILWQKAYGGIDDDHAYSIQQTPDGGYIVAGTTTSFGAGEEDFWILRLNPNGEIIWQKTYGGGDREGAYSIQQTIDGGFVVAGYTYSFGLGNADCWVFKLDSDGDVVWQKTYGDSQWDYVGSIQQTSDGGYILAGIIGINMDPVNYGDILLLKLDLNGNIEWHGTYDQRMRIIKSSILQLPSGGYVAFGESDYAWGSDVWGIKVSEHGEIPGCSLISNQGCFVSTSTVSAQNTTANITNPLITVGTTNISPLDALAELTVFCCHDEEDTDQDGIGDDCDNCPSVVNDEQGDEDGDRVGDACDDCTDTDGDGYGNPGFPNIICDEDNCPEVANADQIDTDSDNIGDICDPDDDNDNILDYTDNCQNIANYDQADEDGDGEGDVCDNCTDTDEDGYGNPGFPNNMCLLDICPHDPDNDSDNDSVCGDIDNCSNVYNPLQEDTYPRGGDGLGDACESETLLYVDSDEGDWVGQGQRLFYTTNNAEFHAFINTDLGVLQIHVYEQPPPGDYWSLWFSGPGDEPLAVGFYEDALRAPLNYDAPGLSVGGLGHGCNQLSGSFEVLEFKTHDGIVESFAARFVQHCEFETAALRGVIYYNFNGPDNDGILNGEDNCLWTPNGPDGGTCISGVIGQFCMDDDDCGGELKSCSMEQEDSFPPGGNGIGDACECESDFNCDGNVDAADITLFLNDFGRGQFFNPCTNEDPCDGDINCDGAVAANDANKFLEDFARNPFNNSCPVCIPGAWCVYQ